jgi:NADH-quinone oxidoreductase subunit L
MTATLLLLTILLPVLGALLVWLVRDKRPFLQHTLAVAFSAAAALCALALIPGATAAPVVSFSAGPAYGDITFVPDGLGVFLAVVATLIGCLAVLFSTAYMRGVPQLGRYYFLVLLFISAMSGLVLTGSLFAMFLFWEVTAFCSYALISFYNDDPKAVRGGMKALLITQIGGVGLLVGALLSFVYLGDYQIDSLLARAPELPPVVLALIAFTFLVAAMAKSAQVPFHTWLPDAMEAPSPISALIHAATMVNAGVYLLARFYPAFAPVRGWSTAVMLVGLITAVLAALMAVFAGDLKRVLAYSTVSQLGYMVYAIGVGSVFASTYHLMSHAVFKALLFLAAGAVIHAVGTRDMKQMGGLYQKMPVTAVCFMIGAAALAGLPIFNGFWSKELILETGLAGGPLWAWALMLLGAALTAWYTLRMVWLVFFGEPVAAHAHRAGAAMKSALIPLAVLTCTTWLLAGPFSALLARTLPWHDIHELTTPELVMELISAPATWLALGVVALGLLGYWVYGRRTEERTPPALAGVSRAAGAGFGFELLNDATVAVTERSATLLQRTQSGQLGRNLAGVVFALAVVLLWLLLALW